MNLACRYLGLPEPGPDGLHVRLLGQERLLKLPTFELIDRQSEQKAKPADHLLLLHLLLCEAPVRMSDEWISFRDLPGGLFYWHPFQSRSLEPLARHFGNELRRLERCLQCFDTQPLGIGDLGARIAVLGTLQTALIYRLGDAEFAPAVDMLFAPAFRHILPTEDVAVLAERICWMLIRQQQEEEQR
ncbi:DUF3786 domain-containing protein [candidate division KSB1 bacterium]|nr:DUF3786 domain-containing protein [candidate division KSB1 bacterium]